MPWSKTPNPPQCRPMVAADWELVRAIYLEGIATSQATFETTAPEDWETWSAGKLTVGRSVAAAAEDSTQLLGWTCLAPVSTRPVYLGVAELTIYVAAEARGRGVGRVLLDKLIVDSEAAGIWTLQGSLFPENAGSRALHKATGFREVGRRERIARLDGAWRDTILVERRSPLEKFG